MKFSFLILGFLGSFAASAQTTSGFRTEVFSTRPMDDITQLLEIRYDRVITYEEPLLLWSEDLQLGRGVPKPYGFALPPGTGTDRDLFPVLQKVIAANNEQPIGPRFALLSTKWGYHVVPVESHDAAGSLVAVQSVLDFPVDVAPETRTPWEHVRELMAAIKRASGVMVDFPIYGLPSRFNRQFTERQRSFEWGTSGVSGRDALMDFLSKSGLRWTWSLRCQSSALPEERFCALNTRRLYSQ